MDFKDFLHRKGQVIELGKQEHVFRQGDRDPHVYFIRSGLLKGYYISEDGKEFVKSFLEPNDFIGSLSSAYLGEECSFSLVCLEPTSLIKVSFDELNTVTKTDLDMANSLIEMLLRFAIKKERREFEFLCLSAESRYKILLSKRVNILDKVTQNDMARYLGITPVALSRIKKRVADVC